MNKTEPHYCIYCLQYKTVIVCLKRTEVCWFVKRTLYTTIKPSLRCITVYFIMIDLYSITRKHKTQIKDISKLF